MHNGSVSNPSSFCSFALQPRTIFISAAALTTGSFAIASIGAFSTGLLAYYWYIPIFNTDLIRGLMFGGCGFFAGDLLLAFASFVVYIIVFDNNKVVVIKDIPPIETPQREDPPPPLIENRPIIPLHEEEKPAEKHALQKYTLVSWNIGTNETFLSQNKYPMAQNHPSPHLLCFDADLNNCISLHRENLLFSALKDDLDCDLLFLQQTSSYFGLDKMPASLPGFKFCNDAEEGNSCIDTLIGWREDKFELKSKTAYNESFNAIQADLSSYGNKQTFTVISAHFRDKEEVKHLVAKLPEDNSVIMGFTMENDYQDVLKDKGFHILSGSTQKDGIAVCPNLDLASIEAPLYLGTAPGDMQNPSDRPPVISSLNLLI